MKTYSVILIIIYSIVCCTTTTTPSEAKPTTSNNLNQVRFRRLPRPEFSAALGSSIIIECEAGGSPPPTIHWLKDGKRLSQDDVDIENQVESDLVAGDIDDVKRMGLGATRSRLFIDCADFEAEATYTCVAENAYTRISSQTRLTIIKPGDGEQQQVGAGAQAAQAAIAAVPQCLGQQRIAAGAPQQRQYATQPVRIHMWTPSIVEIMKNNVILYCRSNKRKLVSWTLPDDQPIGPDQKDKYEILDSGDLLIKDLSWSDLGSYVCTVSDEQGSDSISSFVYPAARKVARTSNQ